MPDQTQPDNPDLDEDPPIKEFRKKLAQSGGGSGVSLHIDAEFAEELKLDPETEVDVEIREKNGDVGLWIDVPAGFTPDELGEFAHEQGWTLVDSQEFEDDVYMTYRDATGTVAINIDTKTQIQGAPVNNVTISSDPIEVPDDDIDWYFALCGKALQKDLRIRIDDNRGIWQRLQSSAHHETDDAPDEETFRQLVKTADTVTVQLADERSSLKTTLPEIATVVEDIRSVIETLDR